MKQFLSQRIYFNRLDIFLTVILPILWTPLKLLTFHGRYEILEDIGPYFISAVSLESILVHNVPLAVITVVSVWYLGNIAFAMLTHLLMIPIVLTIINVWRARSREPLKRVAELDFGYTLPKKKVNKYLVFSTISITSILFGFMWTLKPIIQDLRSGNLSFTRSSIHDNIRQLPFIYISHRNEIYPANKLFRECFFFSIPVMTIILFAFFGLGPEALKTYHSWLRTLFSLLKLHILFNFLQTYPLRLVSWFNRRAESVDPGYFIPFESNDITLDPLPLVDLPRTSRRSPIQPPAQPRIKPSLHLAPLTGIQKSVPTGISPLEERRTYHKQAVPTEPRPIHHSPQSRPSAKDRQVFVASDGRIAHHKEPISSRLVPLTSRPLSPSRPRPSDRLPPPYRRPVDRGSTSDPFFTLF
ncbi:hypothetical protein FRC20_006237 [Serendipita sp. 405]|nr:hypothetical protein FRC20_006237 [Serendipita sp. 405]